MDRWKQYLFEVHSEEELRSWARRLKLFRFFRAYGGHANDGDSLEVAFVYSEINKLESFLARMDVKLTKFDSLPPQPRQGVSYRGDEFAKFPSLIAGTTWIEQPGRCEVMGVRLFIWCECGVVKISLAENYSVSEKNVLEAEVIERLLTRVELECIDPPRNTEHYICPKYYPDYFVTR